MFFATAAVLLLCGCCSVTATVDLAVIHTKLDGRAGSGGAEHIHLRGSDAASPRSLAAAANDAYAARSTLSGADGSVDGSIAGATLEANEPKPSPLTPTICESVWYSWTAPASGFLFLTLESLNWNIADPVFDFDTPANASSFPSESVGVYVDAASVSGLRAALPRVGSCEHVLAEVRGARTSVCTVYAVTKNKKYAFQVRAHRAFGDWATFTLLWSSGGTDSVCRVMQ
jgi:hypothetical protein